jgi:hypothetical protein
MFDATLSGGAAPFLPVTALQAAKSDINVDGRQRVPPIARLRRLDARGKCPYGNANFFHEAAVLFRAPPGVAALSGPD